MSFWVTGVYQLNPTKRPPKVTSCSTEKSPVRPKPASKAVRFILAQAESKVMQPLPGTEVSQM